MKAPYLNINSISLLMMSGCSQTVTLASTFFDLFQTVMQLGGGSAFPSHCERRVQGSFVTGGERPQGCALLSPICVAQGRKSKVLPHKARNRALLAMTAPDQHV